MRVVIKTIVLFVIGSVITPQELSACQKDAPSGKTSSEVTYSLMDHALSEDQHENNGESLGSDHCCCRCKVHNMGIENYPNQRTIPFIFTLTYLVKEDACRDANYGLLQPPK